MFLIKTTCDDESCSQSETTVRETKGEILLDHETSEGELTDKGVVLDREAHDHEHVKPEDKKDDERVLSFRHDRSGEVGDHDGVTKTNHGIAHVFALEDFIRVIEFVEDNALNDKEREKIKNDRDAAPDGEVENRKNEARAFVETDRRKNEGNPDQAREKVDAVRRIFSRVNTFQNLALDTGIENHVCISINVHHEADKRCQKNTDHESVKNFGHKSSLEVLFKVIDEESFHIHLLHSFFFEEMRKALSGNFAFRPEFTVWPEVGLVQ